MVELKKVMLSEVRTRKTNTACCHLLMTCEETKEGNRQAKPKQIFRLLDSGYQQGSKFKRLGEGPRDSTVGKVAALYAADSH